MIVYDIVHGYQPFSASLTPDWVAGNLDRVFLPTSRAMAAGSVRRSVQLQGWTLDSWMGSGGPIRDKACEVIGNLKAAKASGHVEFGFSAYSHAILPLLGDTLAYALMRADYDAVCRHLGEPSFFWFPECAVDAEKLKLFFEKFPSKMAVIPSGAIGTRLSLFAEFDCGAAIGRAAVCNSLLKDVLMNSLSRERPEYAPAMLDWARSVKSMRSASEFKYVLNVIDDGVEHIVARDWENGESRDSLRHSADMADVAAMVDSSGAVFRRLSEREHYGVRYDVRDVFSSSWEPVSTPDNPFPYWAPADACGWRAKVVDSWLDILAIYESAFNSVIGAGGIDSVDRALSVRGFKEVFLRTCPATLSCLPWHLLARPEWASMPDFPASLIGHIVRPGVAEMLEYANMKNSMGRLEDSLKSFTHSINGGG